MKLVTLLIVALAFSGVSFANETTATPDKGTMMAKGDKPKKEKTKKKMEKKKAKKDDAGAAAAPAAPAADMPAAPAGGETK